MARAPLERQALLAWGGVSKWDALSRCREQLAEAIQMRDTAEIDLRIATARMLRKETELSEQVSILVARLQSEEGKNLDVERTCKDNERLRGKLAASKRLAEELHGQVVSERAREQLLPEPELTWHASEAATPLPSLRMMPSPASEDPGNSNDGAGRGGAGERLDWMLESRERDLERVRLRLALRLRLVLTETLFACLPSGGLA